jgi:ornithine--oxo-acid transaminase
LTSRAFYNDQLGAFCRDLAALAGMECVLPMNTGVEAVETAIKVARRWGYDVKGVPEEQAQIVVMTNNFHGRTTTVISFSNDHIARRGFGPFTPGFVAVPFGDAEALAGAITRRTVAVLLEPVQGEAGVFVPPPGYLAAVRQICTDSRVLFLADEIQSGLGRCGTTFACDREDVVPDVYMLGKALGGGIVPVSAVVSRNDVLGVITPGSHGSTFGGNPLAVALGHAVVGLLETGEFQERARPGRAAPEPVGALGRQQGVTEVRTVGLWAGVDLDPAVLSGRQAAEGLAQCGVLAKETHDITIRFAPPLIITEEELDWMLDQFEAVLDAATAAH